MKLNIKVRLKNKAFLVSFVAAILALVYELLAMIGYVPGVSQDEIMNLVRMLLELLVMLGVLVDPTTEGLSDSDRALTYDEPQ